MLVVEHVAQQERRALLGREPLEQQQKPEGEIRSQIAACVGTGGSSATSGSGSHGPVVGLALGASARSRSRHRRDVA